MVPENQVQAVENDVFARLENHAAPVRDKILAPGLNSLTDEEWRIWGIYVNAVAFRTPEALELARGKAPAALDEMLDQMGHLYPALRGNNPETTAREWLQNHRAQDLAADPFCRALGFLLARDRYPYGPKPRTRGFAEAWRDASLAK